MKAGATPSAKAAAYKPIWSGSIAFGLVNIPVKLYKATGEPGPRFPPPAPRRQVPRRYKRICEDTGEEVPYENVVRGYEYDKGLFVVLEDDDFRKANVRASSEIAIQTLSRQTKSMRSMLWSLTFSSPTRRRTVLMRSCETALRHSEKAAVARFVMRDSVSTWPCSTGRRCHCPLYAAFRGRAAKPCRALTSPAAAVRAAADGHRARLDRAG